MSRAPRRSRGRTASEKEPSYIVRAEQAFEFKENMADRWSPASHIPGTRLSRLAGLSRLNINMLRVPAGGEVSVYHSCHREEEWAFVLKGRGVVVISDVEHIIGAGDFLGFPSRSEPHQIKNPFDHSLLCLIGGEAVEMDVVDIPRQGRRLFRYGNHFEVYDPNEAEEAASAEMDALLAEHWPTEVDFDISIDGPRKPTE